MRAFAFCTLLASAVLATTSVVAAIVRDINVTVPVASSSAGFAGSTSTYAYFIANERPQHPSLWRTDGTTAGTVQLADLPWPVITKAPAVALGERLLLFLAQHQEQIGSLWVSDGTPSGTQRLFENAEFLGGTATFVLFQRRLTLSESEVWRTDGTPQGTVLVVPQRPGAGLFIARGSATVAGKLYLVGPRELIWVSDGTAAGTREAPVDSNCCAANRFITDLVATPDAAYFSFGHSAQVLRIDPANDTPSQLTMPDGYGNAEPRSLVTTANEAFFTSQTSIGYQLWRVGGSPGPTLLLQTDAPNRLSDLRAIGSNVVFTVTEQVAPEIKTLWGSDGTVAGTQQLSAFQEFLSKRPDNRDTNPLFSTGAAGEIWTTDGTPAGTGRLLTLAASELASGTTHSGDRALIATSAGRILSARLSTRAVETLGASTDPLQGSMGLAPFGVWFVAQSTDAGHEPFVSDGTAAGVRLLVNIADDTATGDSLPANFIEFNGALYFTADDEVVGRELWRSDGTSAGTRLFADLLSGPDSSHPVAPFVAGNRLYFFTLAGVRTLWSTDGTSAPVKVGPLDNSVDSLSPWATIPDPLVRSWHCPQPRAAQLGSQFYFPAIASSTGWELWKTDGTHAGTQVAVDLAPGFQSNSLLCTVVALNNRLFFTAVDPQGSRKLWRSDGTTGGTQAIETLSAGSGFGEVFGPVVFRGALYFTTPAEDLTRSRLWRSDGSTAATVVYESPAPGLSVSVPHTVGNRLVFIVETPTGVGTKTLDLWATDGTATGAGLLATRIASGAGAMIVAGSQLFFTRTDDATGAEPWVTDGTTAGTRMIQDITVGAAGSAPQWMGSTGSVAIFLVPDGKGDAVMWRTNGTAAETRSIAPFDAVAFRRGILPDPNPYLEATGRLGVGLIPPLVAGNHLFFVGRSRTEGIELFALESDAPPPPPPPPPPVDPPPRRSGGGAFDSTLLGLLGLAVALQFLTAVFRRRGMIVPPQRGGQPCSSSTPTRSRR